MSRSLLKTIKIGPYLLANNLALAPMAGVTDRPFRMLCRRFGAALTPAEMVSSDTRLWQRADTRRRLDHTGEREPRVVQIAGGDPEQMAEAAIRSVELGAQIIDINMGCPAKKVCKKNAGSALLRDEALVEQILKKTVASVDVPVTLKIRTGESPDSRNGVTIAQIAQDCGIQALAVHGRTRRCKFQGEAEYSTIQKIADAISIPVFANGDCDSPEKARKILEFTQADGLMLGRAAQGRPWIFQQIAAYLETGHEIPPPTIPEVRDIMTGHLRNLYEFYGESLGVRIARKHLGWYCKERPDAEQYKKRVMQVEAADRQLRLTLEYFNRLSLGEDLAA